jgi:signal transduction histidine kinase
MGLGMSFVKRVCDAHGFTVDVESAPEAGTTVRIDLSAGLQRMNERTDG